ncbi:WD40/YVTN/BNR-like repeat-containing protein, partial [Gemmatimonadota bacterium]
LPPGVNAPNDLAVDSDNPDRMFLALWPRTENGRELNGGLLLTEDGGTSWRRVFREDAHVFSVALEPSNSSRVYINTFDSSAFTSADGGSNWHRIQGYDFKWGHRVIPDLHNPGMIYLTTFGGGLFHGPGDGDPQAKPEIVNFSRE